VLVRGADRSGLSLGDDEPGEHAAGWASVRRGSGGDARVIRPPSDTRTQARADGAATATGARPGAARSAAGPRARMA
jgi:hypothetical protein